MAIACGSSDLKSSANLPSFPIDQYCKENIKSLWQTASCSADLESSANLPHFLTDQWTQGTQFGRLDLENMQEH